MNSPTALSDRLRVAATGLVRLNPSLGTCYPVTGVQAYGRPTRLDGLHFHIDPVAIVANAATPPGPASPSLYQLAILAGRVGRANWLLLALAALLVLAACTRRSEALAPPAPAAPTGLATVPHGLGPAITWYHD